MNISPIVFFASLFPHTGISKYRYVGCAVAPREAWGKTIGTHMLNTKRVLQWTERNKNLAVVSGGEGLIYAGIHLIADFWHGKNIEDPRDLETLLIKAVEAANSKPLQTCIHQFTPYGMTGVVLLSESHIAIHTWPEISYIAIDIFTCGTKAKPRKALAFLKKELHPRKVIAKEIKRGGK